MSDSSVFCNNCGKENNALQATCSFCQQPLLISASEDEQGSTAISTGIIHERYRLLAQVGSGGYSIVYKGEDLLDYDHPVAIKQISLQGLSSQQIIEATDTFNREIMLLSKLKNEHIPRLHDHFTDQEHWYLVTDFIAGQTLDHYLQTLPVDQRPLPMSRVVDIALQLCAVLEYLHRQQPPIIFRDLKPENIMRTSSGRLYIIDFGIARHYKSGQAKDTIPFGSPGYAAPEQYGKAQTTPASDIYSLGALMHHLLTGDDPSENPFFFAPLHLYSDEKLQKLESLILQMVEREASKRPQSIKDVRMVLQSIAQLGEKQIFHVPQPSPTPPLASVYPVTGMAQRQRQTTKNYVFSRRSLIRGGIFTGAALTFGAGIYTWDALHRSPISLVTTLRPTGYPIIKLHWSQDSTRLMIGDVEGNFSSWDGKQNQHIQSLPGKYTLSLQDWSPTSQVDERYAITVNTNESYKTATVWQTDLTTTSMLYRFDAPIGSVAFSPEGSFFVYGTYKGPITVRETKSGKIKTTYTQTIARQTNTLQPIILVTALTWSPDGNKIISATGSPDNSEDEIGTVNFWQAMTGKTFSQSINSGKIPVTAAAWSPDGKYILCGGYINIDASRSSCLIRIWNEQIQGYSSSVTTDMDANCLAWSPDSQHFATGYHELYIRSITHPQPLYTIKIPADDYIETIAWSPDGNSIACGSYRGRVYIYHVDVAALNHD
ncbi:MAG TPA: WD40 repeat domain-containing serine/threonine protein kinase [Dictyobacter sp.]|jgi:serine/threonine protein kinase|nr:WD40 repeat domain-containing serine/threonine protein kinase [Dictyobacter sp.]